MKYRGMGVPAGPAGSRYTAPVERKGLSDRDEIAPKGGRRLLLWCLFSFFSSLIVASFQSGFFSVVRPFGTAPDLCLAFTVACGILFGSGYGAVTGIASGFLIDALSLGGFSVNVMIYFVCGALVGSFRMHEPRPFKDVWRYAVALVASVGAKKMLEILWVVLTAPTLDASKLFSDLLVRGSLCTVVFSFIVYIPTVAAFCIYRRAVISKNRF